MGMIIMNGKEYTSSPKDGFPPIIYSDEEREIGVWRDGKPLYQKVVITNNTATGSWIAIDISALSIDTPCFWYGAFNRNVSGVEYWYLFDSREGGHEDVYSGTFRIDGENGNPNGRILYKIKTFEGNNKQIFILQYTKTTDIPGSGKYTTYGELAHHYSTTEQVVGTWIDGKPVYEKLITFSSDVMVYSGQWVNLIQLSDYNINKIIELKLYNGEYTKPLSSYMSDVGNGYLKVFVYTNWSVKSVIIQYTKTTD